MEPVAAEVQEHPLPRDVGALRAGPAADDRVDGVERGSLRDARDVVAAVKGE